MFPIRGFAGHLLRWWNFPFKHKNYSAKTPRIVTFKVISLACEAKVKHDVYFLSWLNLNALVHALYCATRYRVRGDTPAGHTAGAYDKVEKT